MDVYFQRNQNNNYKKIPMNKQQIEKISQDVFKENPKAKKVFITSDGYPFLSENAANLHKNTNRGKKKLEVLEVANNAFATSEPKEVKLSKMNKTLLTELATSKGIDVPAEAPKADIIKLIEEVINAEIK